jgi:hypothetical protein
MDVVDARDEATLLLSGASVHSLTLEGAATAMLSGGAMDVIDARDETTLLLSGASVHSLTLEGTASARMIDGAVAHWAIGPTASASMSDGAIVEAAVVAGELAISGGDVSPSAILSAEGEGALSIRGGLISDVVLEARDASRIEIVGGDFAVDGVPAQFGALPATAQEQTLTGTLNSGDPILARYLLGTGAFTGTIVLQPGPDYQPRIDIKPGNDDNTFNLDLEGAINVAILSSILFDALEVDPATIDLSGAGVNLVGNSAQEKCFAKDVDNDGFDDLVCRVDTFGMMIEPGESVAVLEAQTFDGIWIRLEDSVRIVP